MTYCRSRTLPSGHALTSALCILPRGIGAATIQRACSAFCRAVLIRAIAGGDDGVFIAAQYGDRSGAYPLCPTCGRPVIRREGETLQNFTNRARCSFCVSTSGEAIPPPPLQSARAALNFPNKQIRK